MPQCQFLVFYCFCVSEKLHRKYSGNWMKQKPNLLIFTEASRSPKRRRRGATGQPHHRAARPALGLRLLWVRPLMTHKYRGCIVVLSINKSVEPNEEQKVLMSSFNQGFTVNTSKQVFRGIW
jgi:hypothetical protein